MNYMMENDTTQKVHIHDDAENKKYDSMIRKPNVSAMRKFRTEPYFMEAKKDGKLVHGIQQN